MIYGLIRLPLDNVITPLEKTSPLGATVLLPLASPVQ